MQSNGSNPPTAPVPTAASAPAPAAPVATPAAPLPNPLAHLSTPFTPVDFRVHGVHLTATVAPSEVVNSARELDAEGFWIDTITGLDWMAENQMEVVYDFFHVEKKIRAVVRARIPRDNPELPTISNVFPGANWHERETHDFFGIRFTGHPDLSPFLLPEEADYHPLKKDFAP